MNSIINRSGAAAVTLCGLLLVSCNAVEDVRDEPFTTVPPPVDVLKGSIIGLGNLRPVILRWDGQPDCNAPDPVNAGKFIPAECRFAGAPGGGDARFSFGSIPAGTPYNVEVRNPQPFGKICTVANASGTIGSGAPDPVVTCADNPATLRYNLIVDIAPSLRTLPNLKVTLDTEEISGATAEGTRDATGLPQVTFTDALMNTGTNLPLFGYKLTATTETTPGDRTTAKFCTFTATAALTVSGRNLSTAGGAEAAVVPTGPVTVALASCAFTVTANVQYNGTPAQTMPAGGMTIALRNHLTGVDEQTLPVAAFSATNLSFPVPVQAHSKAIYELVVPESGQPAGMRCVVAGTTTTIADTASTTAGQTAALTAPTAAAVLLVDPDNTDWWAFTGRQVRCRAKPAAPNVLSGTFQTNARIGNQTNTGTATVPARAWGRPREFLTFFPDGTFLYGLKADSAVTSANFPNETFPTALTAVRSNWGASSGVTHGFYNYNSAAGTIVFTVLTSTITNPGTPGTSGRGLTGMPGFAGGAVTASSVVKNTAVSPATLSLTFTTTVAGAPTTPPTPPNPPIVTTRVWPMTAAEQIPGQLTGTWITADHRRMFNYHGGYTFAFHMGVNGLGNLQDLCMIPGDGSTQSAGIFTRHAGNATDGNFFAPIYTCTPGVNNPGTANVFGRLFDLPHYAVKNSTPGGIGLGPTTPRLPPAFVGRFPGTNTQLDARPNSPVNFQVVPGNPDTLTVRNTLNGVPIELPITFIRQTVE